MTDKSIRVKIVYRNYKPLHMIYESLVSNPPDNVNYVVPKPVKFLSRFMFLYRKYKKNLLVKSAIRFINKLVFSKRETTSEVDIYQFVNMVSGDLDSIDKPFIVDVERATSLAGFTEDEKMVEEAANFLLHPQCAAIVCMSRAAERTLKELVGENWSKIKDKTEIIYPTIPLPDITQANNSIIKNKNKLNLLFVGNQSGRKGLPDLLEALRLINDKYPEKVELFVVSGDADELVNRYNLPNVRLYKPAYSKKQMLENFFIPADLFVFPTRGDTYGLAVVDALAAGTPVIATKQFALRELIDDQKDGILMGIDKPALDTYLFIPRKIVKKINSNVVMPQVVEKLVESIEPLINDPTPIATWSKNARAKFSGRNKLSIDLRNRQYNRIYKQIMAAGKER